MKVRGLSLLLNCALWLAPALMIPGASGAEGYRPGPLVGKPAPAFQVQGIFDESLSLEAFKGHILVMQFGASW